MLKNFFKTAWRNLIRNKTYSLLNIPGLAAGMAVALLIGLWIHYQYSYNKFLPGNEQVYKVGKLITEDGEKRVSMVTPLPLVDVLQREVPGIKYVAATDWLKPHGLTVGEKRFYLNGAMAGVDFLNILQYPLVQGNKNQVLKDPYSIVLNESTAKAFFGEEDPVGKTVRIDNSQDLKVTGIMKDVPQNSTLQFQFVVPFEYFSRSNEGVHAALTNWDQVTSQLYVALEPTADMARIQPLLNEIYKKYSPKEYSALKTEVTLQPLSDWHLYSEFKNGVKSGGLIDYVKMFGLIGAFVLIIACINFVNLATARSDKRAKEVGVRKAIGSSRAQIIFQFMIEAVVMSLCAFGIAVALVSLALPAFSRLTNANISIPFDSPGFWLSMSVYVAFTALLAGSRPAFYMSSFRPVKVLKGVIQQGRANMLPRKALVVIQFSCSIALIISTVIIYQQVQHARSRQLGYNLNSLLMTDASGDIKRNYSALKNDLLASGVVSSVTKSSSPVTENWNFNGIDRWPGKQDDKSLGVAVVAVSDNDYFGTTGMKIISGRNFEGVHDSISVVVNQAAVNKMGLKNPVNQLIRWDGFSEARIVGVVSDALMDSPFGDAKPTLFLYSPGWSNIVSYRIKSSVSMKDALAKIAPIFDHYNPGLPYLYKFADEAHAAKFKSETLIGKLSGVFAALAMFISCLGLFGLAAFAAEQRTKEIGIRKVLGASVRSIWFMLSKEFMMLILISVMISAPVVIYFMNDWLAQYSYRVQLSPSVFIFTTVIAFAITIITISFQSIKAALSNPVKSLKAD